MPVRLDGRAVSCIIFFGTFNHDYYFLRWEVPRGFFVNGFWVLLRWRAVTCRLHPLIAPRDATPPTSRQQPRLAKQRKTPPWPQPQRAPEKQNIRIYIHVLYPPHSFFPPVCQNPYFFVHPS